MSSGSVDSPPHTRLDALTSALQVLRELDMPPDEVAAIVAADQPLIVHAYIELHRERLEERFANQVRILERLERILTRRSWSLPLPGPGKSSNWLGGGSAGLSRAGCPRCP
jgi:hypothetical protein